MKKVLFIFIFLFIIVAKAQRPQAVEGLLMKTFTTAQLDALTGSKKSASTIYYNSTINDFVKWDGSAFVPFGGSDGNDFPTGITVSGGNLTIDVPNQGNPTISLGSINLSEFNNDAGYLTTETDDQTGAEVPLTGYTKAATVAAVSPTDDTNTAIGKVERVLDDKTGVLPSSPENVDDFWIGTQAQYTGLGTYDPNVFYLTTDEPPSNSGVSENQITSGTATINYDVIAGNNLLVGQTNQTTNLEWQKIGNFFWFSMEIPVDYQSISHTPSSIFQSLILISNIPEMPLISTAVNGYATLTSGNSITHIIGRIASGSTNLTMRVEKIYSDTATAAAATNRNITITGSFIVN